MKDTVRVVLWEIIGKKKQNPLPCSYFDRKTLVSELVSTTRTIGQPYTNAKGSVDIFPSAIIHF